MESDANTALAARTGTMSELPPGDPVDRPEEALDAEAARTFHAWQAEELAGKQEGPIVLAARSQMEALQARESDRLAALAEINPNIRQEEIDHLAAETDQMRHYLDNTHTRLEALRVAVVTD